jgi:hypothetical protein
LRELIFSARLYRDEKLVVAFVGDLEALQNLVLQKFARTEENVNVVMVIPSISLVDLLPVQTHSYAVRIFGRDNDFRVNSELNLDADNILSKLFLSLSQEKE